MVTYMVKKIFITVIIISSIFFSLSFFKIEDNIIKYTIHIPSEIRIAKTRIIQAERPIGKITIPKININKPLYDINSEKNNIEENITILKGSTYPDQDNSTLFIAAHSGDNKISFFENLDQLKKDDEITITYNNQNYTYIVKDIYEKEKDGYITGPIEKKKQLILTTCCPKKEACQLIINCIEKESS